MFINITLILINEKMILEWELSICVVIFTR